MKSGINHGNRHSLPPESGIMQLISIAQLNLSESRTVNTVCIYLRLIDYRIAHCIPHSFIHLRSSPYFLRSAYKRQCGNMFYQSGIIAGNRNKIFPFPYNYNIHSLSAYFINILTANRQVGGINRQVLFLTSCNGFLRKELFRMLQ